MRYNPPQKRLFLPEKKRILGRHTDNGLRTNPRTPDELVNVIYIIGADAVFVRYTGTCLIPAKLRPVGLVPDGI
jgi:hypothetical protein